MHRIALRGMNIGGEVKLARSGEMNAIHYVKNNLISDHPVLFDVGANVGSYTHVLQKHFDANAKIYAFEPSSRTFEKLQNNIGSSENVHLFQHGFGEKKSSLTLYFNPEKSTLASVYNRNLEHFGMALDASEEIHLETIDGFCKEQNIDTIDFLKIDVEGHETSVLNGAEAMLSDKKIQFIQFEFGGCNIDSRTFFQDFFYRLKDHYTLYRIVQDGLYPIPQYTEGKEIFMTTNYLAELKH